ncbi:MAG: hypothetical protein ACLTSO_02990 [Coprococcus sp.]
MAGCGSGSGNGEDASTSGGKGRYVEENWGDPLESQDDNSYSYIQTMKQLSDGTIRAIVSDSSDRGFSVKDSTDGGKTWGDASMDLSALDQLNLGDDNTDDDGNGDYAYVANMTIDADGDLAFVYTQTHSETKDNVTSVDSTVKYYLLTKDGKLREPWRFRISRRSSIMNMIHLRMRPVRRPMILLIPVFPLNLRQRMTAL